MEIPSTSTENRAFITISGYIGDERIAPSELLNKNKGEGMDQLEKKLAEHIDDFSKLTAIGN